MGGKFGGRSRIERRGGKEGKRGAETGDTTTEEGDFGRFSDTEEEKGKWGPEIQKEDSSENGTRGGHTPNDLIQAGDRWEGRNSRISNKSDRKRR